MNPTAQQNYLISQVNTASPGQLTLMLYNGCIRFIKQAMASLENNDFEAKNENTKKATLILDEFIITLNYEYELSNQLKSLYVYMKEQLIIGNIRKDMECYKVVLEMITDLRDTWGEALKQTKSGQKVHSV